MPVLKNSRHEKFAFAIFEGMNQRDAAIEAGYKPNYIDQAASRLYRNVKILARVQEFHESTEAPGILNVKGRKKRLSELAEEDNEGKFGFQRQPNVAAIAELNKMERIYEAEGTVNIDNSTLVINVNTEKAKQLTEQIIEGERTGGD